MHERAQVREANMREREQREAEKCATSGGRRQQIQPNEFAEVATPLQLHEPPATAPHSGQSFTALLRAIPSPQLWASNGSLNAMSLIPNAAFYYNPCVLPHLFSTGTPNMNMSDINGRILWIGSGV